MQCGGESVNAHRPQLISIYRMTYHSTTSYCVHTLTKTRGGGEVVYFECLPSPCSPRLPRCQRDGTFMRCWTPCIYPVCQQQSCSSPRCKFHCLGNDKFYRIFHAWNQNHEGKLFLENDQFGRWKKKYPFFRISKKRKREKLNESNALSSISISLYFSNHYISNLSSLSSYFKGRKIGTSIESPNA